MKIYLLGRRRRRRSIATGAAPLLGAERRRRNAAFGEADCSDVMGRAALVNLGKHDWLVVVYPPLWKMMDFVNWDDDIPNISGKIKDGNQTTNQMIYDVFPWFDKDIKGIMMR